MGVNATVERQPPQGGSPGQVKSNDQTPERRINVDVEGGEVTLRGVVDSPEAQSEAARVARETEGVKDLTNEIRVEEVFNGARRPPRR